MKITFVEPRSKFEGLTFGWLKHLPFAGILYLATILKQRGHDVEIVRESILKVDCNKLDCDVLCLSTMTSAVNRMYEIADEFKRLNQTKRVIIGGVHANFMPEEALQHADQVVLGEADSIIVDIIENKYKNKIIQGQPCENLDELPFPDLSLIKNSKLPLLRTPISTSRGCPFNCNFCSTPRMFGRRYRFRSPDNIIKEILSRKNKRIFFLDDNLCALKERSKEIFKKMIDYKINIPWATQTRLDIANDDELLNLLTKSNCNYLCLGLESINPKTLKEYNKSQSLDFIKSAVKKIHDHGIKIHGMFIFGGDEDNKEVIKNTVEFCNKMEIESPQFSILTPLPGTQLYDKLDKEGRIFTKNWDLYDLVHAVFEPKQMSAYELQESLFKATKDLYWITKRGLRFFFENIPSGIECIKKGIKWNKDNKNYLEFLKERKLS